MNICYLGGTRTGKTLNLKNLVSENLRNGVKTYVVGRLEEWLFHSNIKLYGVQNITDDNISDLLSLTNCTIIIDSVELLDDIDFINKLAVKSRTSNIDLYIVTKDTEKLDKRVLTNLNSLYVFGDIEPYKDFIHERFLIKETGYQNGDYVKVF